MPGTLSMADLVIDLKASLMDSADPFKTADDGDFKRHLNTAALAFTGVRPRTLVGTITLIAEQAEYAVPGDYHNFKSSLWDVRRRSIQPWETQYPGRLPDVRTVEISGVRKLHLDPPPTSQQIAILGSDYKFYYYALHTIHATDPAQTTLAPGDRGLLILRAQAEAMADLAKRNLNKPVSMREGTGFQTRNGTPAALFKSLLEQFHQEAAR